MTPKADWFGLSLVIILCLLALYALAYKPDMTPIRIEPFLASAGDGVIAIPTAVKCTKIGLNTSSLVSTFKTGGNTWLCDEYKDAEALVKGKPSEKKAYISRNDIVCISQDSEMTIYTCINPEAESIYDDEYADNSNRHYTATCNAYYSKYVDISDSATSLQNMMNNVKDNSDSVASMIATLDDMHSKYACINIATYTGSKKAICNAIIYAKNGIVKDKASIVNIAAIIQAAIQPSLNTRFQVMESLRQYKCDNVIPDK